MSRPEHGGGASSDGSQLTSEAKAEAGKRTGAGETELATVATEGG